MKRYELCDEGNVVEYIEADDWNDVIKQTQEWVDDGAWAYEGFIDVRITEVDADNNHIGESDRIAFQVRRTV